MTVAPSRRPSAAISTLIETAPSAALVLWGVIVAVLLTSPIQPYTDGTWGIATLLGLGVLGALAALVSHGATGMAGVIVGFAAAVAVELFVLAGQAAGNIGVVAGLVEPPWSERVATGLLIGLTAILGGYLLVALARAAVDRRRDVSSYQRSGWLARAAPVAAVLVAAAVGIALLVTGVADSAYVPPSGQPVIHLEVAGDEIVSDAPAGMLVGRTRVEVMRTRDGRGDIAITAALTPAERDALASGHLPFERIDEAFIGGSTGLRDERRVVQLETPATYAFIVWDALQEPDVDDVATVLDAQAFEVAAGASGSLSAAPDGGLVVRAGAVFGILVGGWSAAGTALMVRRHRWAERGRPATRDIAIACAIGAVTALLLAFLALAAIDLARNPF